MDTHAGKLALKHTQRRHESVCFASAALSSLFPVYLKGRCPRVRLFFSIPSIHKITIYLFRK